MPLAVTTKKTHIRDILGRTKKVCHTYDTSMMIIVTKPGIIVDVVGSYFYDKKSCQKMGYSSWAGWRRSCMTFFGSSMTEKPWYKRGGGKFRGVPGYGGRSGAERCTFLSNTYTRVCEALALTEPERGVGL